MIKTSPDNVYFLHAMTFNFIKNSGKKEMNSYQLLSCKYNVLENSGATNMWLYSINIDYNYFIISQMIQSEFLAQQFHFHLHLTYSLMVHTV